MRVGCTGKALRREDEMEVGMEQERRLDEGVRWESCQQCRALDRSCHLRLVAVAYVAAWERSSGKAVL